MIVRGKWIKNAEPGTTVSEVAGRSVRMRLEAVSHYLPLAANKADQDSEYVHQLRVATRRANAALRIYSDLLPRKGVKAIAKELRRIRKAAGDARDLDVLAERLGKELKGNETSHLGFVLKEIAACRKRAQKPLVTSHRHAKRTGFEKKCRKLVKRLRWRGEGKEPTFFHFAKVSMRPMVDDFFVAAGEDLTEISALHEMRIRGKRVRYAMELLSAAFEPSFRGELYPVFAEVQSKLGTINDHAVAITTLGAWSERAKKGETRAELAQLVASEESQLELRCQQFRLWWTEERVAALAAQFDEALHQPSESQQ
jgi:CHAD domain-containing protein